MLNRSVPAFTAGVIFAVLTGGGITYAATGHSDRTADRGAVKWASVKSKTHSYNASGVALDLDDNGYTDTIATYRKCPRGTQMTGGGVQDYTSTGWQVMNAPDDTGAEAWMTAVSVDESVGEDPSNLIGSVECWSPRATISGGYRTSTAVPKSVIPARMVRELAAHAPAMAARAQHR